jgi:hypothetical protein
VVRLLVALEDQGDRSRLEAVAVIQRRGIGEGAIDAAGGGRVDVAVHPRVRVPPNDSMLGFEAGELYVLGVGAADGDDVHVEGECSLNACSFGAADGACPPVAMTRRGCPPRTGTSSSVALFPLPSLDIPEASPLPGRVTASDSLRASE